MAKDPTTSTRTPDFIDELAAKHGLDPARLHAAIKAATDAGTIEVNAPGADPALAANALLARVLMGQLPALHPEALSAFAAQSKGITRRAELRPIAWEQAPGRPAIEGLVEAVVAWALLKEQQGPRLGLTTGSVEELKFLATVIQIKRGYLDVARTLAQSFEADVAVDENRARQILDEDVGPIRAALERDPELRAATQPVRDYLYGAAQRGADTRADLAEKRKAWTAQTATTARVAGIDEGMRRMEEKVKAALDGAGDDTPPDTDPTDGAPTGARRNVRR